MNSFSGPTLETYVDEATRQALINLESKPAPAGIMSVVLGPGWPGFCCMRQWDMVLEGDFNRKNHLFFWQNWRESWSAWRNCCRQRNNG